MCKKFFVAIFCSTAIPEIKLRNQCNQCVKTVINYQFEVFFTQNAKKMLKNLVVCFFLICTSIRDKTITSVCDVKIRACMFNY